MELHFKNANRLFNSKYLPFITNDPATRVRYLIFYGGRGGGRSTAVAQGLILRSCRQKIRTLLLRKVHDTIKQSSFHALERVNKAWGLDHYFDVRYAPLYMRARSTGSEFITRGMDRSDKIKSIDDIDTCWLEEATEITEKDWIDLNLSIRGRGIIKQIILTFNPEEPHWIKGEFFNPDGSPKKRDDAYYVHGTYRDNQFLDQPYIETLEALQKKDDLLWRKVVNGEWVQLRGLIFPDWKTCDAMPEDGKAECYGFDYGEVHPSVLTHGMMKDGKLYFEELIYRPTPETKGLIELMKEKIPVAKRALPIYIDPAAGGLIGLFRREGFNAINTKKPPGSIKAGIGLIKAFEVYVTSKSENIWREQSVYKWRESRDPITGMTINTEDPVDWGDDAMDTIRYQVMMHFQRFMTHDLKISQPKVFEERLFME